MNVFIGHQSALEYWRSISLAIPGAYERSYQEKLPKPYSKTLTENGTPARLEERKDFLPNLLGRTPSFSKCKPNSEMVRKVEICGAGCFSEPISFVVSEASQRWRSGQARCHVHETSFPRGSFVRLSNDVYVASPELCFVQVASSLSLPKLMLLGYELCGVYTTGKGGYAKRPPLSSVERIDAFLERAGSLRGANKARRALKHVADASASPKESELALLLGLPRAMGGYGLGIPCMNWKVSFRKSNKKISGSSFRYVDLYWPRANLGIEYDSDWEHTGSAKIARDASRKNALFAAGADVLVVTKEQLMSDAEMDKVASILAKRLGKRFNPTKYNESIRRRVLRWELFH